MKIQEGGSVEFHSRLENVVFIQKKEKKKKEKEKKMT